MRYTDIRDIYEAVFLVAASLLGSLLAYVDMLQDIANQQPFGNEAK